MRINCKLTTQENSLLVLEVFGYKPKLEAGKLYSLDIKEYKSNRSLEQNRLMWAIIQQIASVTKMDEMDIYIAGLLHAKAKYTFLGGLEEVENELKKNFRAVKAYGTFKTEEGKELIRYQCFYGSSKFNTKEMTTLVNYFTGKAYELGIETEEY